MKFALVNKQRQEAHPNLLGECPVCGRTMDAKCGEINVWHWAHRGTRLCDPWWENETEWHRKWKGQFPADWQEFVHHAADGELHIADVKTDDGWVIEFQHSSIKPEERRSREAFYPKLVWVVDGLRRARDKAQFLKALNEGKLVGANSPVRRAFLDECRLLREWTGSASPVFFDFGEEQNLGCLLAGGSNGLAYVAPFPRPVFIGMHRRTVTKDFNSYVEDIHEFVALNESLRRTRTSMPLLPRQVRMSRYRRRL